MADENVKDAVSPFALRDEKEVAELKKPHVHVLKPGFRCVTDKAGQAMPNGMSERELVLDASEGFIPLWEPGVILRWQFADGTLAPFQDPAAAGSAIESIFGDALLAWGDAAPVKFSKNTDACDFEIVVRTSDDCDPNGCVLASAFFPDAGRHQLYIYPIFFRQTAQEQLETLCHEIGHAFGLRHFFALVSEQNAPAVLFGRQDKFTIMNYGELSRLTDTDKSDLKTLYELAWSGQLKQINGTPLKFVKPYHEIPAPGGAFAMAAARS
jgi:hypothetical protein